jgi:hypothetical protein
MNRLENLDSFLVKINSNLCKLPIPIIKLALFNKLIITYLYEIYFSIRLVNRVVFFPAKASKKTKEPMKINHKKAHKPIKKKI